MSMQIKITLIVTILNGGMVCERFAERVINDFRHNCRYVELCYPDRNASLATPSTHAANNNNFTRTGTACCEQCSCEDDCGFDCCPDKPQAFMSKAAIAVERSIHCVRTIYRSRYKYDNTSHAYKLYAECPEWFAGSSDVVAGCSSSYDDFRFNTYPVEYFMPVSSTATGLGYKNQFCAMCWQASVRDLVPWTMNVECRDGQMDIAGFQLIQDAFDRRPDCHLTFRPPGVMYPTTVTTSSTKATVSPGTLTSTMSTSTSSVSLMPETCGDIVDRCNVTGEWQTYDMYLETACLSYLSTYTNEESFYKFKNMHCFLCNSPDHTTIHHYFDCINKKKWFLEPIYPFVQLLDFSSQRTMKTQTAMETDTLQCKEDTVFNELQNECKPLLCADGLKLAGTGHKACSIPKPDDSTTEDAMFHINYIIKRIRQREGASFSGGKVDSEHATVNMLHKWFLSDTDNKVSHFSALGVKMTVCKLTMDVIFDTSIDTTVKLMSLDANLDIWNYISYIDVRLAINAPNASNIVSAVADIFHTKNINILDGDLFNITSLAVLTDALYRRSYSRGRRYPTMLHRLNLSDYVRDAFDDYGYNNGKEQGVLPFLIVEQDGKACKDVVNHLEIWPDPFEPKVELLYNDATFDKYRKYKLETQADCLFNCKTDVVNYQRDGVFVALEEFSAFQKNRVVTRETSSSVSVLSWLSVICTVVSLVCLSLTLLVYLALPQLRTLPGLNNMALVVCLILSMIFYVVSHNKHIEISEPMCACVAIAEHFTLLAYVFWMLVCTYHVARVFSARFCMSRDINTNKQFIRYNIAVLMLCVCLVSINMTVGLVQSDGGHVGYGGSPCYVLSPQMVLYTVAVPIALVIMANLAMFSLTAITLCRLPNMSMDSDRSQNMKKLKILAKLSTLTGTTWVFGYLFQFTNYSAFAYVFVILNAGQGAFLFMSFVLTKRVFKLLKDRKTEFSRLSTSWFRSSLTRETTKETGAL